MNVQKVFLLFCGVNFTKRELREGERERKREREKREEKRERASFMMTRLTGCSMRRGRVRRRERTMYTQTVRIETMHGTC